MKSRFAPPALLVLSAILLVGSVVAETAESTEPAAKSPSAPAADLSELQPARQFDFLIGEWTYEFPQGHGSTRYRKSEPAGAIVEHLEPAFFNGNEFTGMSVFFHDPESGWKQNWIDSFGNVLLSEIELTDYEASTLPALVAEFTLDGARFRHVWYDIRTDRFETDLLASNDGETYTLIRRMPYLRKGS